ncbi:hypothetical protein PV10_04790 [Exophiala mesophila]|uniref:MARVEL domain-containing protein n=1 Tax=Exophiala mesophila TaxID=212818 RepID=A0A0D1ZFX6_EXOME|nr:uncharacterized protein PV10_04790 [Exophiala mesophila]KIV93587.1 hypothetical protein PV10_04790 [Exophiala mesophila]
MEPLRGFESDIKQTESLLPGAATFPRPSGRVPFRRKPISERHERLVYRTRLTLRILTFVLSLALVIVLGHAVSVYYSSKDNTMFDNSLRMDVRIWPLHMKMKPTLFLLGSASVATLLSGIICVGSFSKAIRRITTVSTIIAAIVTTITTILWVAIAIFYKVDDLNPNEQWDMISFTCARRHDVNLDKAIGNLGSLCLQMRYSWFGALAIGVLEICSLGVLVWAWWVGRAKKSSNANYEMLPPTREQNISS